MRTDPTLFVRKFLRHGTRVAAITPSSPWLAAAMCAHVDAGEPQVILELGAGDGAVTQAIVDQMHPNARLLALEIDPDLAARLRRRCPEADVVVGDVVRLGAILQSVGLAANEVDLVVSGLPTPSLPPAVVLALLESLRRFAPRAVFSQLTVMPWVYRGFYRRYFRRVEFDLVVRNIPPGGAYHCFDLRPPAARPAARPAMAAARPVT